LESINGKINKQFESLLITINYWEPDFFDDMPISHVNAFNEGKSNTVVIPAGIIRSPLYDKTFPQAMNYGSLGGVIGHEIHHSFHPSGMKYQRYGKIVDVLSKHSTKLFNDRKECFVDFYNNFCYRNLDVCVNGTESLGENMADSGGVRSAFFAYRKFVSENGPEPTLSGLKEYSMEQIFFISYARFECGVQRENEKFKNWWKKENMRPVGKG